VVKLVWPGSYDRSFERNTNNLTTYNWKTRDTIDLGKLKVYFKPNGSFRIKSKL
jgi:hypothetical protein